MKSDKITIFTAEAQSSAAGRPTSARGSSSVTRISEAVEVSAQVMEQNVSEFVESVSTMIKAADDAVVGDVALDTVEVAVQIGVDGKVGFLGLGLGANAASSMKIVFKRK